MSKHGLVFALNSMKEMHTMDGVGALVLENHCWRLLCQLTPFHDPSDGDAQSSMRTVLVARRIEIHQQSSIGPAISVQMFGYLSILNANQ